METSQFSSQTEELSFKVFEKIILSSDLENKEKLMNLANIMLSQAEKGEYSKILKEAYKEAYSRLDALTIEQIVEIKTIINK